MTIYSKILCALILLFTWMTGLCFGDEPITEERLRQIIKEENEKLETHLKQEIVQVKAVLEAKIENRDFRIKELDKRQTIQMTELDKRLNIQTQWIQWGLVFLSAIMIVLSAVPIAYNLYKSHSKIRSDFEDSIADLRNSMTALEQKMENYQKTLEQVLEKVLAEKSIERP